MQTLNRFFPLVLALVLAACTSAGSGSGTTSDEQGGDTSGTSGGTVTGDGTAVIADHLATASVSEIPDSALTQATTNLHIFYGHTSHGSQLMTGLELLGHGGTFDIEEPGGDLGSGGDLTWADTTRDRLNQAGNNINVVIWSWCGGVSGNSASDISAYLTAMDQLEQDFPQVRFIYMTGHLDGSGSSGNLHTRNEQIRTFARTYGKTLFDFADIETYDPDGTSHLADGSDACEWCSSWCSGHTCGAYATSCTNDSDCAHSHCFNCYQKGKAFMWLLARLVGWEG